MERREGDGVLVLETMSGTANFTFDATGIGEHYIADVEDEEKGNVFDKMDFDKALAKVCRKVKK